MIDALTPNPPTVNLSQPSPNQAKTARSFADALAQKSSRLTASNAMQPAQTKEEQLRQAAGQLVATAFILPFMKQTRDAAFKSDLFGGGFAQDAMREKLDVEFADRLANSDQFPLVDALVQHLNKLA